MRRSDGRMPEEIRPVKITPHFLSAPLGSCLIEIGKTRVVCSVMMEESVPPFLKGSGKGWLTAEYSMLPGSSTKRVVRERKGVGGRTHEIQRLIGRSLRTCVDLSTLGERSLLVDCDVFDADGGTRTAAVTGSYVALALGLRKLSKSIPTVTTTLQRAVAAISVGIVRGTACLDLHYIDDKDAEVDMNIVKTSTDQFVEVQGTAETTPFNPQQLQSLLNLADQGLKRLFQVQQEVLSSA